MIKRNTWTIFYLLLVIGIIILYISVYNSFNNTKQKYIYEQENITKITANSINSVFLQYETILNILGTQLIQNDTYQSFESTKKLLDSLIENNPSILSFSISKENGNQYLTTTNLQNQENQNLLEKEETKNNFEYTIKTDKIVLGRTHFIKSLNKFVIPIRKAIRDKNHKIIAIITANIDLNSGFDFLIKNQKTNIYHETFLFRGLDNFFQIAPSYHEKNHNIYETAIPENIIKSEIRRVEQKYNKSINELKDNEIITTINSNDSRKVLYSSIYIKKYELWLTTQILSSIIDNEIYKDSAIIVSTFIFIFLLIYFLFKYIDKHERSKEKLLYHQANHDYLTNLYNRLYLANEFKTVNKNKPFSLFFIDMDNFKSINDNYGHNNGDLILKEIALRLSNIKKSNETLVRYSGDEFILVTPIIEKNKLEKLANKIIDLLSEPYYIKQYQFILGSSIGISLFPKDGKDFNEIKRYADIAMYEAKKIKNTYTFFDDTIKEKYIKESLIEEELKSALLNNEIYMMYQPQVDKNNKIYGVEALIRWKNKKLGFISPNEFIKIAESTGLIEKIGEFIIKTSLEEIKTIQKNTNTNFQLSINISVKQFLEVNFYSNLFQYIREFDFDKEKITLEMTESTFIEDVDYILNLLIKIKQEGLKISLDDFGTGYSSLNLLRKLPIDELKIDKSFVDDILNDSDSLTMIQSIISIGKKLNMIILAEGVETIEQQQLLVENSCDLFQGYFYSKPLRKNELENLLKNMTN